MPHVPNETQDVLGNDRIREAVTFKAHDNYVIDGDGLNKLNCLVARFEMLGAVVSAQEMRGWVDVLRAIVTDSKQAGVLD